MSILCVLYFFVFFLFVPTFIVQAGSLKATKGNSTSVCTFSTAPLEPSSQIRFWLDHDVKKPNKQTRRDKDKKRHNAALHLGKGIFFFFKLRPRFPSTFQSLPGLATLRRRGGGTVSLAPGRASTRPFWSEGRTRAPGPTACYPGWTLRLLAPTTETFSSHAAEGDST